MNAQNLKTSGNVTSKAPNGKSYRTEFYDVEMNGAEYFDQILLKGKGTYYLPNKQIIVYAGEIVSIDKNLVKLDILGTSQDFQLSTNTKFCDGKKSTSIETFKKKMIVTITTGTGDGNNWVQTLRKGPTLWKQSDGGRLVLNKYSCN